MSYTYEVHLRTLEGHIQSGWKDLKMDQLDAVFLVKGAFVSVFRNGGFISNIYDANELSCFREGLERAHAWKPTPVDNNKKTAVALNKPRISDVPPVAMFAMGAAMSDGAAKYGRYNWRDDGATVSVFVDAMTRHLLDYWNGEDFAHDSRVHHLAHLMAGGAILLDAALHGKLNDDRGLHKPEGISRLESYWKLVKKDD